MKIDYFRPLVMFLIPTILGGIVFWPRPILTPFYVGGFAVLLVSVAATYTVGIRRVLRDRVAVPNTSEAERTRSRTDA
jgi:hypothetical protein